MEQRGLHCPRGGIFLPSLPLGCFCPRISRQRMTGARKKPSRRVKLGSVGADLPKVQRQHRARELGKLLGQVRCTRLVFLRGHSSKEWKVPGWLSCV